MRLTHAGRGSAFIHAAGLDECARMCDANVWVGDGKLLTRAKAPSADILSCQSCFFEVQTVQYESDCTTRFGVASCARLFDVG